MTTANTHAAHPALAANPAAGVATGYLPRAATLPVPFTLPTLLTAISWSAGGLPGLTDLAFICLACLCFFFLFLEFYRFPRRFGIGGMALFGGVLTWFCYDYFTNWFGRNFNATASPYPPWVIAKAAFFHCLFIQLMLVGLIIPRGQRFVRLLQSVPEPASTQIYFWVVLFAFAIGFSPYLLFTVEPVHEAVWMSMTGGRGGGATWTVGRTGNVNYSWGAYIAQIMQIGQVGGQLAAFYAILGTRSLFKRAICWVIWAFWLAIAFGTGARGHVAFMALPVLAGLFIRYQAQAAMYLRLLSKRAYIVGGIVVLGIIIIIQIQARYRTETFKEVKFSEINVLQIKGNSMFSEGLLGYQLFPNLQPFAYDRFPGETIVRAMPQTLANFLIGPIPRALWHNKPLDPLFETWSASYTGRQFTGEGRTGTTVATGLVGYWYFRFGVAGVIQGALLFGWLAACAERALQGAQGRLMTIIIALGFDAWLFRCFRDLNFNDLYPLLIGTVALSLLILASNKLLRA